MTLLEAIILGIIQGFTEFLPISSSGHLAITQNLFGMKEPQITFDVVLHIGTLIPVLIVFWGDIWTLIKKPFQKMTGLLILGTVPAVVFALLFKNTVEALFANILFLAAGFTITGIVLILADRFSKGAKTDNDITIVDALLVGCAQGVAIAPAISRSGSTIAASLGRKMNRETAAKFSFLLSIPAILGAAVMEGRDVIKSGAADLDWLCMGAGFLAAMLSGYLAVKFMLNIIKRAKLKYFAVYVFILAVIIIAARLIGKL